MHNEDECVYECLVDGQCITNEELNFQRTVAVCTTQKKARLFRKGYLLEQWKHKGYTFTGESVIPYYPGHVYYAENKEEKWILNTYIISRHLDELWINDEEDIENIL